MGASTLYFDIDESRHGQKLPQAAIAARRLRGTCVASDHWFLHCSATKSFSIPGPLAN